MQGLPWQISGSKLIRSFQFISVVLHRPGCNVPRSVASVKPSNPADPAGPDRPSGFSDGSYGVYYAGDRFDVALAETAR